MSNSFYNKKYETESLPRPKLSIAVPTHQFENNDYFFRRLLNSLWDQTFQDFEIVVTDNSDNYDIRRICQNYGGWIKYFHNSNKGMAQNTNEAIRRSSGELIKVLYMDDFMAHDMALSKTVKEFQGMWMVTACKHTLDGENFINEHIPTYSEDIHKGINTIGSPSVMTIRNVSPLLFDEEMTWLLDCDYYHRMHKLHGEPHILKDTTVIIGLGDHQLTNTMGEERKLKEQEYINNKYV